MRLILKHGEMAVAAADVKPFLGHRKWNDWKIRFDKRIEFRITDARNDGDFSLGQILREQTQIPSDEQFLRHQTLQIFLTFDVVQVRPHRRARTRRALVSDDTSYLHV